MAIDPTVRPALPALRLMGRLLAALPAGYGLMALTVAVMGKGLSLAGVARSDAVVLATMLGFVFYLVWLIWAFSVRRLGVLWMAACGGIGLGACALWWGAWP